ncbi:hypothetical protein PUN28_006019 [Cardiocondyla obscurior]|uniref:Uncharacterized protein n=1 Tax=Cardiocondyla obscurior TaxID=286306 RepID=A0AAW2GCS3_9HYME
MAYLHPLGGVARPPLFRDDSLNTARRTHPPSYPLLFLSLFLALSTSEARLLPIHPLGMPPFHPVTSGTTLEISRTRPRSCAAAVAIVPIAYTREGPACAVLQQI